MTLWVSCSEKGLSNFLSWSRLTSKIHHPLPRLLELTQVVEDIEIRSGLHPCNLNVS